jgi:ABC-type iron transport system FetAB ATPase subunit
MAALRLEGLHPRLLQPVDLRIDAGGLTFVSGPSGAGKSLLLRAVADLDPNHGEVYLDGIARSALSAPEWRRRCGLLPAESGWWAERVGAHFPGDGAAQHGLLAALGFDADVLGWEVARLSTGERQRLALARLLAHRPEALLLDEATANLDPSNCGLVEAVIDDYRARHKAAVLWVSHDPAQRSRLGDASLVIDGGRLVPEPAHREPSSERVGA